MTINFGALNDNYYTPREEGMWDSFVDYCESNGLSTEEESFDDYCEREQERQEDAAIERAEAAREWAAERDYFD